MERNNDYACTGWYPILQNAGNAATRTQLLALRDLCLLAGMTNSAAAIDNALDVIAMETVEHEAEEADARDPNWIGGKAPTDEEIGALAIKATSGKLPHVRRTRGTWNTYEPEL